MSKLTVKNLSFSYDRVHVLHEVSFSAEAGQLICFLGPNGVGKSTLFGCILGILAKYSGDILLDQKNIKGMTRKKIAQQIAFVPQFYESNFNYSVLETVLMGLNNQINAFSAPNREHYQKALEALERMSIAHLADAGYYQISGGERQLVLIARALVQNARILIMDEPTANLDFGNQNRVLKEIRRLCHQGYLILFSSHQPEHAFLYANIAIVLNNCGICASGAPSEVLTETLLTNIYQTPILISQNEVQGKSIFSCIPRDAVE